MVEIFLTASPTDHGHLLITHESGLRLGFVDGRLVEEIPGARVVRLSAADGPRAKIEPRYVVPAVGRYRITLNAESLRRDDIETVGVIGPSHNVSIRDIPVRAGAGDVLTVDVDREAITYSTPHAPTPTIRVGVTDSTAAYDFELRGLSDEPGTEVTVRLPIDAGLLSVSEAGSTTASRLSLQMRRFSDAGVDVFRHHGIALDPNETAVVKFGDWGGGLRELIPLTVHHRNSSETTWLGNRAIPSGP